MSNATDRRAPLDRLTRVDLSHAVEDGVITHPGLPVPAVCDFLSRAQSRPHYAAGTEFQIGMIVMCANTGTYVDSPFHRYADGVNLAWLPLDRLESITVDLCGHGERAIDRERLLPYDVKRCG